MLYFEEFSTKIHEKSRKNENYQNSFDKVIDNHMDVPETAGQVLWSDLELRFTILTKSSFKDSGQNSEKKEILMLWDASVTLRGILQKNIDEASKKNNFQKKVYRKIFIFRGDRSFSRAKKCKISQKVREISISGI